jgi:multicomponent Na+:H+ antiporter subunit D
MVTAALFGGLLTKIGIYALLRVLLMLFPPERLALSGMIEWLAIATIALGAMGALAQTDVRRLFGFLVIAGVGTMLAGMALGDALAVAGTIVYAGHSMLAMAALYLLAGAMHEVGGSFMLTELGGLYGRSPFLAALAFLIFLAVAGLPPGSGLWPKVMLVKASIEAGEWRLAAAILVGGLLITLALGRVFLLVFWKEGKNGKNGSGGDAIAPRMSATYLPLAALAVPILLIGLFPEHVIRIGGTAAAGLLDSSAYVRAVFPEGTY